MVYIIVSIFLLILYLLRSWLYQFYFFNYRNRGSVDFKKEDYDTFIEIFYSNDWDKSFVTYYNELVTYYSGDRNMSIFKHGIFYILYVNHYIFIKNPFVFYKLLHFLKGNPPLTKEKRKIKKRDNIIDDILN